jgi:putative cell wall-binding protein
VEISKASFPGGVSKVFVVSGQNFPDALAAGPVAALQNGALLLTHPSFLPDAVAAEISRLAPSEIIVIGGNSAVSPEVEQRLRTLAPRVSRVGGASRFETAVMVNQLQHQSAATVFVTTGLNYPDALSAAAAAHNAQAPLLLVDGSANGLPVQVRNYVASLRPTRIVVLGGTSAVSAGVFSELSGIAATQRVSGAGRVETSVAVGREFFAHSDSALLAFAWNFPDALAGSMLAARKSAPLFIVNSSCVPRSVINEFRRLGVSELFVLGGPAALSERVPALEPCD